MCIIFKNCRKIDIASFSFFFFYTLFQTFLVLTIIFHGSFTYTPRVKYRKSFVCNSPCNFVIYLTKSEKQMQKIMQKLSFLPDISLFTPISIDTFFHLCANESVICRFLLFLFFIPWTNITCFKIIEIEVQKHHTSDTFKKIKKSKIYATLSTKKKK